MIGGKIAIRRFGLAAMAVMAVGLATDPAAAVFFDLRGLTPSQSLNYDLSAAGIDVRVGSNGFTQTSGPSTFGIDSPGANDNPLLIDGGNGSPESFFFSFAQDVFFESILISQFGGDDAGSFTIRSGPTTSLANGLNVVGGVAAKASGHLLAWTGPNAPTAGRGFSVDGFTVRLLGIVPTVKGDYNRNGAVDAGDYVVWRKTLGNSITPFGGADGDGDGTVNAADYLEWRRNYRGTSGSGLEALPIPEPSVGLLVVVGLAALSRGRWRLSDRPRRGRLQ